MFRYISTCRSLVVQDDLIKWWSNKRTELPVLYKLALVILAIPVSSAPVEGSFNQYKNAMTKERSRLSAVKAEKIQLLNYNKAFE